MRLFSTRATHGVVFFFTGVALLATSAPERFSTHYHATADLPSVTLDNARPLRRITIFIDATEKKPGFREGASVSLRATHSDPNPQLQANNTPWVSAYSLVPSIEADTSFAGASESSSAASAPFLETGYVSVPISFTGSCEEDSPAGDSCFGEANLVIERAPTADDTLVTTVEGTLEISFSEGAKKNSTKVLPWVIEFSVEESP